MQRLLALLLLPVAAMLLLGACASGDGGDDGGGDAGDADSEAQPASGAGAEGGDEFCTVVEEKLDAATGEDLLEAVAAIQAMADAAPVTLNEAFDENLAALEPVTQADDAEAATQVFLEEVAAEPAFTDSFTEIESGIDEECGIDVSSSSADE